MRRKSMLPGAILTLLTLICLLIPGRVTLGIHEKVVGWLSPVLHLVNGTAAHAAGPGGPGGDTAEPSLETKAKIASLESRLNTAQRILDELRGRPLNADTSTESANPANPNAPLTARDSLTDKTLGPLGRFLARPIWNGRALYTVDVGEDQGLQIGDGVIAQGGGTGVIVATSATTATFSPLSYPGVGVQAMVQRSRATGLLTGTGRGLELRYLQLPVIAPPTSLEPQPGEKKDPAAATATPATPADKNFASYHPGDGGSEGKAEPAPGDLIVATGRDGLFPEGTPLGWVETVAMETKASGGLLRVTVKPWCDPNCADAVRVVPRRPEPIPLPDDPRDLRKHWEALQAAAKEAKTANDSAKDATKGAAKP